MQYEDDIPRRRSRHGNAGGRARHGRTHALAGSAADSRADQRAADRAEHGSGVFPRTAVGRTPAERQRGAFPNARQATRQSNSPWLVPLRDYKAWMKKRGQPVED